VHTQKGKFLFAASGKNRAVQTRAFEKEVD
jgi:hypothetical protein